LNRVWVEEERSVLTQTNTAMSLLSIKLSGLKSAKNIAHFSAEEETQKGKGFLYQGQEYIHHTDLDFKESAFAQLTFAQKAVMTIALGLISLGMLLNWHTAIILTITFLTTLYFADLLFNLFLVYRSYFRKPEVSVSEDELVKIDVKDWPMYTILCPLYKEWEVLPQFIEAMTALDYPKDKLQVMLLLEANDEETITKANGMNLPSYFEVVVVPHSKPKTKPKACNYGLDFAKGEYVVIYDAEDKPDVFQLKKAVLAFKNAGKKVICIQAKLNFYNATQNILTRLFTLEYSLWFDLVLTGLQSIHAPIPLGGTSNHFRRADLLWLRKWDPFNVTEDADLGMRIVKRGYHTALIDSYTMEEANSQLFNWFKQRSRWVKGYIQTYFVHMRSPRAFFKNGFNLHILTFQLVIGGKVISMLVNPILWMMTLSYLFFTTYTSEFINSLYLLPVFYIGMLCLFAGNFLYMYYYMMGAAKRNEWSLIPFALLTPFYWLAMSGAAYFALYEFVFRPHYWHKTKHGLHLSTQSLPAQTQPIEAPVFPNYAVSLNEV
jgi:glycosyltransferase XagB